MNDVFLSFTRMAHRDVAERVEALLDAAGLRVYVDKQIEGGASITEELVRELGASRLVVVVYSEPYNRRWACQWEFVHAYLAGAAEGDAYGRILIVNPEAGTDHIAEHFAGDSKFRGPAELDQLVSDVRAKLARVPGPIGAVRRTEPPRWLPSRVRGAPGFTGRFRDLWRIHNALSGPALPMTVAAWSGPAAVITGLAGIGKTALVNAYAWLFEDAYPGGVFTLEVEGPGGVEEAFGRYALGLRRIADLLSLPADGVPPERLALLVAGRLDRNRERFLWFVDGLPDDLDRADIERFMLPSRHGHPVFTARRAGPGAAIGHVPLDGVGSEDGLAILATARPVPSDGRGPAQELVARLGGHPLVLTIVAARLRDEAGLAPYPDQVRSLTAALAGDDVLGVIGESMDRLDPLGHEAIALAGVLAPAPAPAALIGGVLTAVATGRPPTDGDVGTALGRLRNSGFAQQVGDTWRIHPLVVEASARIRAIQPDTARLARAAAELLAVQIRAEAAPARTALLVQHAHVLIERPALRGAGVADELGRELSRYHTATGDLARAAQLRHDIAGRHPDSTADRIAAALACVANGEYARALDHAQSVLDAGHDGSASTLVRWAYAAALDGLGRFEDATGVWAGLDGADWTPTPTELIAFDVARARARIARGRLRDAAAILEPLAARKDDDPDIDQVNGARLELARVRLFTSAEVEGRRLAEQVVTWYRERGALTHFRYLEAELLWAEAAVALALFELRPDTSRWAEAERTLDRLVDQYPKAAGEHSVFGLAARVAYGLVLVRLGKQARCRAVLLPILDQVRERLGARHPLFLRARYALGLAHAQLGEFDPAIDVLGPTWETQRSVLGPAHPETLHTQFEFGIALKFRDGARAAAVLDDAWNRLPRHEIGWRNDLYGKLFVERPLRAITPPSVMRAFNWLERARKKLNREE